MTTVLPVIPSGRGSGGGNDMAAPRRRPSIGGGSGRPALTEDEQTMLRLYGDEQAVGIAAGTTKPMGKAPAVASVITARDIKAMGATDIDEVLAAVPGLHVSHSFTSYLPIYSFRGIFTDLNPQVLFLINGIPITVPSPATAASCGAACRYRPSPGSKSCADRARPCTAPMPTPA
jgi:hypothetical protein